MTNQHRNSVFVKMFRIKVPRSTYPELFTQEGYNELCAAVRAWQSAIENPEEIEVIIKPNESPKKSS